MTPVQTAAAPGSLCTSHAETGGDLRVAELWWIARPTKPQGLLLPGDGWVLGPSRDRGLIERPQKWEACEKEKLELGENFPAQHVFLMGSATWSKPKLSSGTC